MYMAVGYLLFLQEQIKGIIYNCAPQSSALVLIRGHGHGSCSSHVHGTILTGERVCRQCGQVYRRDQGEDVSGLCRRASTVPQGGSERVSARAPNGSHHPMRRWAHDRTSGLHGERERFPVFETCDCKNAVVRRHHVCAPLVRWSPMRSARR